MPTVTFPNPMYVSVKNGPTLIVKGALSKTEENYFLYQRNNSRDIPPNMAAVAAAATSSGAAIAITGSGVTATPAVSSGDATVNATSSVAEDDNYAHIQPRPEMVVRTMFRWWAEASPGKATKVTGTTVSGSAKVAVGSIRGLFPGQAVSGTGIPANAKIQEVQMIQIAPSADLPPQFTPTIVLTHQATASASVELTIAAGADDAATLVGECWADRYDGMSAEKPKRY